MMTKLLSLFLLLLSLNIASAQPKSPCCMNATETASYDTYHPAFTDTLVKFDDGENTYARYILYKSREDTIIEVEGKELKLEADTIAEENGPEYEFIKMSIDPPFVDTIRTMDTPPRIIAIDTMVEEGWDYARIFELNPKTFFKIVAQVKEQAIAQGFTVKSTRVILYNHLVPYTELENLTRKDLKHVRQVKVDFILEKDDQRMSYPIIFMRDYKQV